jgi:hypothetical protein
MAFQSVGPIAFESVSNVTAANSVELGTRVTVNGNDYIYVYNAGNSQISKGYGAVLSGTTGYSVTVSAITMVDFAVGICRNATLTTGTYGWLMTRGFSTFVAGANDSFAAGNPIALAVDGAFANKTISTGYVTPHVGKTVQASDSGASAGYGYFSFI